METVAAIGGRRNRSQVRSIMTEIYVRLLNEIVDVWRPVLAEEIGAQRYRIISDQTIPDDEVWEFGPGRCVDVQTQSLSDGDALVAVGIIKSQEQDQ